MRAVLLISLLSRGAGSMTGRHGVGNDLLLFGVERHDKFDFGGVHLLVTRLRFQRPVARQVAANIQDYIDLLGILYFDLPCFLSRPAFDIATVIELQISFE